MLLPFLAGATSTVLPAQKIIEQMYEANRTLSYQGDFIYQHHNQMDTMRVIHKVSEDGIQEKIMSLSGSAREVIRDKDSVLRSTPDAASVMIEKGGFGQFKIDQLAEHSSTVSQYYRFSIAGQERIADRSAWVLDILPKDKYRYGYQLWIDLDTKLLLKSELKNNYGVILERFVFTKIEIMQGLSDELFKPTLANKDDAGNYDAINQSPIDNKEIAWESTWIPDGFFMRKQGQRTVDKSNNLVDHLIYSDGLAFISVFIEKLETQEGIVTGFSNIGGTNAFSAIFNKHLITAIGEVPRETITLLAQSIVAIK